MTKRLCYMVLHLLINKLERSSKTFGAHTVCFCASKTAADNAVRYSVRL